MYIYRVKPVTSNRISTHGTVGSTNKAPGKFKEVKSRLFDYQKNKENKPSTSVKPTTKNKTKSIDVSKRQSLKPGLKRSLDTKKDLLVKRRQSEVPRKQTEVKPVTSILKRKSCTASVTLKNEEKSKVSAAKKLKGEQVEDEKQPSSSVRRLSYTICEAVSTTSDTPPPEPAAHVAMTSAGVASRNVRFQTPPNNGCSDHVHKKLRKTPRATMDRRYIVYVSRFKFVF